MDAWASAARDERTARMLLSVLCEPGDGITGQLLSSLGGVATVKIAGTHTLVSGVDHAKLAVWHRRMSRSKDATGPWQVLKDTERLGLDVLIPGDPAWPVSMNDLRQYAPFALWAQGITELLGSIAPRPLVGIIGARAATNDGLGHATEFASRVAEAGNIVASAGSYGVDAAAHRAALTAGQPTIAVLAGGLERLYPAGNTDMLQRIGDEGLLVSECPPGSAPTQHRFLRRNVLLGTISDTLLVVEAGARSWCLTTARHAAALGRPVGAIPGAITSPSSTGCNLLLQEGTARVVITSHDVTTLLEQRDALSWLRLSTATSHTPTASTTPENQRKLDR